MTKLAISQRITTLNEAETRFNLVRAVDPDFFREWQDNLPKLSETEKAVLNRIKARYRYFSADGQLAESVVNLVVLSPLLDLAGFYDPPFRIRGEVGVEVSTSVVVSEDEEEILRGRIDFLVISQGLWIAILEAKASQINLNMAIPQTLAYMVAHPHPNHPIFAMATNGGEFFFVKFDPQYSPQYDISRIFSHLPLQNEYYEVFRILKQLKLSLHNR